MTAEWRPESTGGPSWPALRAITRVRHPRDPEPSQLAQLWRQHVTAAVAAFHAHRATGTTGTPLVFGWLHPDLAGPATIAATSHNGHHGPLLFPASTDSRTLPEPELSTLLAGLPVWTRVGIATSQPADSDANTEALTGGLDAILASWPAPYGWLLHATPITPEHASELAAHEAEAETKARANALKSARHAQTADQHAARYREYAAAPTSGLWQLHLLAASTDSASAHAVAGLLSAGFSLHNQPYTLIPTPGSGTLAQIWATSTDDTITGAQSPQTVSTKLLAALATLPRSGLPGIAVEPSHTFSLNVPQHENGLRLGHVIRPGDGKLGQPVTLAPDVLAQHMFVTGTTGSGKTTTIRGLLHHATAAGVPWLVIEPTKTEYRQLATSSDVVVLRPGDPTQPAIGFNPLQPVSGFGLQTHADLTRALFTAAFDAAEPFPQILDAALTAAYEQAGWDLVLSQPSNPDLTPAWPTLTDLHRCALHIIAEAGYGKEIEQNVHGFVNIRLAKLSHGTTGTILNAPRQLDIAKLMRRNVILELDNIGDDADKAFLMGALLIQLTGHLRTSPTTNGLRHLTVVEEAHRLLRKPHREGPAAHAVEQFSNLLAEVRAYGEGLIIADQIPTKLINDVLKNTSTKIAHRLPDKEDRDAIAATTNLTASQSQDLVSAQPGHAAVHTAGMKEPAYTSITAVTAGSRGTQISAAEIAAELPAGCGPSCHDSPCTVADHRQAQRLLAGTPPLRIWADLTVLAHLVGLPAPTPAAHLAASIALVPETLLRHALGAATTASVRSRLPAISSTHSPETFAAHVVGDLHSWTSGAHLHDDTTREPEIRLRCMDNPAKWRLEPFRYNGIRHELAEAIHRNPNAPRHPNSSRWETLLGKPIPGATAAEQMTIVAGWSTHLSQRYPHTDTVLFGLDPAVPSVLGISIHDADWPKALDSALESFETGVAWIQAYLAAQPIQGSWR